MSDNFRSPVQLRVVETTEQAANYVGNDAELMFNVESNSLTVHNGVDKGGVVTILGVGSIVPPTQGGTGITVYQQGDTLYASEDNTLARLTKSTKANQVLTNKGTNNNPIWSDISLAEIGLPLVNYGGIKFDGSSYLKSAQLTGIADSKTASLFMQVRFTNAASGIEKLFGNTGDYFLVTRTATGKLRIQAKDVGGLVNLDVATVTTPLASSGLYTIMLSFDIAGAVYRLWINEVEYILTPDVAVDANINYTVAEYFVCQGAVVELYSLWFTHNTALNWGSLSVRRKFTDAVGLPIFIGAKGEFPTGTQPLVYLGLGTYDKFKYNRGSATGNPFVVHGSLLNVTNILYGVYYGQTTYNIDEFEGDGATVLFTLSKPVFNPEDLFLTVGGVHQPTDRFTLDYTTLEFVSPPPDGVAVYAKAISFI